MKCKSAKFVRGWRPRDGWWDAPGDTLVSEREEAAMATWPDPRA